MPPPWLLFEAAVAFWAVAGAATKQLSRLANVTNRTAKDRISLEPPPFGASGRRASCALNRIVSLQKKAGHGVKALHAQAPEFYGETQSLSTRCKNDTVDALGELQFRASVAVNINSLPSWPTSTVSSALMEIGSPLFTVSRMMFFTW
jgi:hypothetical protein